MSFAEHNLHYLRIYRLETHAELLKAIRSPAFTIPSILFPWMFYVFFGLLFNPGSAESTSTYLIATYGTFGIIGVALFSFGIGVAIEKEQGWLDLKQVGPVPGLAFIIAKISMILIFSTIIIIGLFVLGSVFGNVRLPQLDWLLMLLILLFGTIPFCLMGLWLGFILKGQSAAAVINMIYLPMSFFSGLWVPIHIFPDTMQQIALALPAFHIAQLTLKVIDMDLGLSVWLHIIYLTVVIIVFTLLAQNAYRKFAIN